MATMVVSLKKSILLQRCLVFMLALSSILVNLELPVLAGGRAFPGLKTQPVRERKALVLGLISEAASGSPDLAEIEGYFKSNLSPEDAQLFILPIKSNDKSFNFGIRILVDVLLANSRIGELTDLLTNDHIDVRTKAREAMLEAFGREPAAVISVRKANIVQKDRFVGRLLDIAPENDIRSFAELIASFDLAGDLEGALRRYDRTKTGAIVAANAVILMRLNTSHDIKKEIHQLSQDANPFIRKLAENYFHLVN